MPYKICQGEMFLFNIWIQAALSLKIKALSWELQMFLTQMENIELANKGQGDLYLTSQGVLTRIAKFHHELFILLNAHSDFHPEGIPGSGKCTHVR